MKKTYYAALVCLCIRLASRGATARAEEQAAPCPEETVRIDVQAWISHGSGKWEIDGMLAPGLTFRSLLDWDSLDNVMMILKADLRLGPIIRLRSAYGSGDIEGGRNTDTDWLMSPDLVVPFKFSESISDTKGETTFFDADLLVQVFPRNGFSNAGLRFDFLFGYITYTDELIDADGIQTIIAEVPVYDVFPGLNATYGFEWRAYRAGISAEYLLTSGLLISATAALLLDVTHKGQGYWAIRDDLRPESPNMTNDADGGLGSDMTLAASYYVTKYFAVEMGWKQLYFKTDNGRHRSFSADGSVAAANIGAITTRRTGFFAGIKGTF